MSNRIGLAYFGPYNLLIRFVITGLDLCHVVISPVWKLFIRVHAETRLFFGAETSPTWETLIICSSTELTKYIYIYIYERDCNGVSFRIIIDRIFFNR